MEIREAERELALEPEKEYARLRRRGFEESSDAVRDPRWRKRPLLRLGKTPLGVKHFPSLLQNGSPLGCLFRSYAQ